MCNERIDNCDNLLIVDSRYIDYFFYLLYCFYNEKCDEKSYISLESFNKNKSKIKVDFSSINLLFELSNSIDYSKLNEFKSFVKKTIKPYFIFKEINFV